MDARVHRPDMLRSQGAIRRKLPDERQSITHKFDITGHEGWITVGLYEDGTPGEMFLTMAKEGSTISGFVESFAKSISYCLQYGVPLQDLVDSFVGMRFEPAGKTGNTELPIAKSIVDYVFRWMAIKFLEPKIATPALTLRIVEVPGPMPSNLSDTELLAMPQINTEDAPPCSTCGTIMVAVGLAYKCPNCHHMVMKE